MHFDWSKCASTDENDSAQIRFGQRLAAYSRQRTSIGRRPVTYNRQRTSIGQNDFVANALVSELFTGAEHTHCTRMFDYMSVYGKLQNVHQRTRQCVRVYAKTVGSDENRCCTRRSVDASVRSKVSSNRSALYRCYSIHLGRRAAAH